MSKAGEIGLQLIDSSPPAHTDDAEKESRYAFRFHSGRAGGWVVVVVVLVARACDAAAAAAAALLAAATAAAAAAAAAAVGSA